MSSKISGLGLLEERTDGKFQIYRHKSSKFTFRYDAAMGSGKNRGVSELRVAFQGRSMPDARLL